MIRAGRIRGELTFDFIRLPNRRVSQKSLLLDATDDTILIAHELSAHRPVSYMGEIVMDVGYWGIWSVFKNRPFNVGRIYRPDRTWTGYYVDVLEPVQWEASDPTTLRPITDLFLDLWIAPDGGYMILDQDEFEEAISLGQITSEQVNHARGVLQELREAVERGEFPPSAVREFSL